MTCTIKIRALQTQITTVSRVTCAEGQTERYNLDTTLPDSPWSIYILMDYSILIVRYNTIVDPSSSSTQLTQSVTITAVIFDQYHALVCYYLSTCIVQTIDRRKIHRRPATDHHHPSRSSFECGARLLRARSSRPRVRGKYIIYRLARLLNNTRLLFYFVFSVVFR